VAVITVLGRLRQDEEDVKAIPSYLVENKNKIENIT
jgi:hypothetical protein